MKLKRKELLLIISVCFIYWGAMILGIRWFKNYASRIELSEELQIELEEDQTHAEKDARRYLEEKYHMDFELNYFEPYIHIMTSDGNWLVRTHYDRVWIGNFTVNGKKYAIRGNIPEKNFSDDFQLEQIRQAYEKVARESMPTAFGTDGVECEVGIVYRGKPPFFSQFYDGSNIDDILKENAVDINVYESKGTKLTEEFKEKFKEELLREAAQFEKKYEGSCVCVDAFP